MSSENIIFPLKKLNIKVEGNISTFKYQYIFGSEQWIKQNDISELKTIWNCGYSFPNMNIFHLFNNKTCEERANELFNTINTSIQKIQNSPFEINVKINEIEIKDGESMNMI